MMMQKDVFVGIAAAAEGGGGTCTFFTVRCGSERWDRILLRVLASMERRGVTGTHPYTEKAAKLSGSF